MREKAQTGEGLSFADAKALTMTVEEAAASKHGVSPTTIYAAMNRGEIKFLEFHGRVVPLRDSVDEWQPGSGGGVKRAHKTRGPGRPRKKPHAGEPGPHEVGLFTNQ